MCKKNSKTTCTHKYEADVVNLLWIKNQTLNSIN